MKLPDRAENFLKEYEELCKKYNIMILSEGEQVELGKYEKNLWWVKESTENLSDRHIIELQ